jgi:choline transporter-like protein 2/4/5
VSGIDRKRGCTDVICLCLFLAFVGGWIFVGYFAYREGDVAKVIYPTDSKGRICGNGTLVDRPYLLFFDLTRCLNPAVLALGCQTRQVGHSHAYYL